MKEFRPNTSAEIKTAILDALSRDRALAVCGGGSKAGLGGEVNSDWVLNTSNFTGIVDYEPNELVLTAKAGTPISEIASVLKEASQHLSFEPPDWQLFLGNEGSTQTIGGVIASNFSGPRRVATGAARDFFLGLEMVTGRGEIIKSGGKVFKNVTGYDLCKLLAGSFGTLGILTEVSVKCQPLSQKVRTVLVLNLSEQQAVEVMSDGLNSHLSITGAAHLPEKTALKSKVNYVSQAGTSITALRIEGVEVSVIERCRNLRKLMSTFGTVEELHYHNSKKLWEEIANINYFCNDKESVWRVSIPPYAGAAFVEAVRREINVEVYFDWGGGLVWVKLLEHKGEKWGSEMRALARKYGGHAALVRPGNVNPKRTPFFEVQDPGIAWLNRQIKHSFDPKGILNPGKIVGALL